MRFAVIFSIFCLAGCAIDASAPTDEGASGADEAAAKKDPCAVVRCAAGTHCVAKKGVAACVADAAECATDADCRLFNNYCGGCACDALSTSSSNPVCKGTIVNCLVAPCAGKTAVCTAGKCSVN